VQALLNPAVRRDAAWVGAFSAAEYEAVNAFYDSQPSLSPTPLVEYPALAAALGVGTVMVKDESSRFGLSAFKSLGARFAMNRLGPDALAHGVVCATAGNHGRAVARVAHDLGVACTVFVPAIVPDTPPDERAIRRSRIEGMRADHAEVVDVPGTYEEAVQLAAAHGARTGATIVSDTAWPGYEVIPRDIMAGYTRLFTEASRQWSAAPDVVLVQAGVGGLLCAAASWLAFEYGAARAFLIGCEPDGSACLLESARVGTRHRIPTSPSSRTIMAGLRCAEPSHAAWPAVRDGVDAFVSIPDSFTLQAIERLAGHSGDPAIEAGPSGTCGIGALMALASAPVLHGVRAASRFGRSTRALAIVTEGK
jgi:diaminopropionate ammonia-lyase